MSLSVALTRENLPEYLAAYARLIVQAGCAIQPGQDLFIRADIQSAPLVREVTRAAYELNARHVTVRYTDEVISRMEYDHAPMEVFERFPEWSALLNNSMAQAKAAVLTIDSDDPEAMIGINPAKLMARSKASHAACKPFYDALDFGRCVWCIVGAASPAWAMRVFPETDPDQALLDLWAAIFETVRLTSPDANSAINAWHHHRLSFAHRCQWLNSHHFDSLHYTSPQGTDLTVGLNARGLFCGGGDTTIDGVQFFPNMPTEEIYSTPDRARADGVVVSTLPLAYNGSLIQNFSLTFTNGAVTDLHAEVGEDVLRSIVETDENSCRLGEIALVPFDSPIRNSGVLFLSTLFDENASCHLALGQGFPDCYQGGYDMSEEELLAAGVNASAAHVDFMIGSEDLSIDGITQDGTPVPIFRNGNWGF